MEAFIFWLNSNSIGGLRQIKEKNCGGTRGKKTAAEENLKLKMKTRVRSGL